MKSLKVPKALFVSLCPATGGLVDYGGMANATVGE